MTAALAFDTLQYSKRLQQAGVAAPVADAQAEALAQVLTTSMDALATRADLERVSLAARTDLERVEAGLKRDILALEQRMTIKLGSMLVVAVGVMAVVDKLL